ncbi:MAG: hypothetical protein ACJA0M_001704 [Chitinophagales bacterium]|jgi:hypothetical protein
MRRQVTLLICCIISVLFVSFPVNAGAFKSGYDFIQKCSSAKAQDWGICLGYVQGVADSLENFKQWGVELDKGYACFPEQIKGEQLRDAIVLYMADNTDTLPYSASGISIKALVAAYPCEK